MTDVNRIEDALKDEFGTEEADAFDAAEVYPNDDEALVSDEEADAQDASPFEGSDADYNGSEGVNFGVPDEN